MDKNTIHASECSRSSIDRICEYCKKPFAAKTYKIAQGIARFCSRPCLHASRRMPAISCSACGALFFAPPSAERKFCSRQCGNITQIGKPKVRRRDATEIFWSRVDKNGTTPEHVPDIGPCWLWSGAVNGWGYGHFRAHGKHYVAHRFSYQIAFGAISAPCVCHRCDNPRCIRPEHLFLGTHRDNALDMMRKGRHASQRRALDLAEATPSKRLHG